MNIQFFWEKKSKKGGIRSRFNLLLLEYGEYYLEDFSAYQFAIGSGDVLLSLNEDLKIQGRLKMSSRSLVFEPNESRYPLMRFPYKFMQTDLIDLQADKLGMSLQLTGVFTFSCTQYIEMKAHNKIGPFKVIELPRSSTPSDGTLSEGNAFRFVFALVHSRLQDLQLKVEQFRHIVKLSERNGMVVANQHLKPFIEHALISTFDSSNLVDFHEKYLLKQPLTTRKILPLIANPGSLMLTESRLYFQPAQLNNIGDASQRFELRKVQRIYKRRYLLRPTGLEFFLEDGASHLFVFESRDERDAVYDLVHTQSAFSRRAIVTLDEITRKWQRRELTNFQYLMHLNNEAGRTMNDLTQYPVFPHILKEFRAKKLNFDSSAIYRDLSRPIGALNPERLAFFRERYESMPPADPAFGLPPPFLYGTHYSTPGYVLFYLVRVAPEYMLCLQNGRFDAADRMFHSVADMWDSCLTNPADLKELIPEFFTGAGDFLSNADDLDLGHRSSGERLHDVVLPAWADSPRDFVRKNAKALESEYVSEHLHEWIDLIFGSKQRGEAALNADNLFYHLTYEGAVDLDSIKDVRERSAIESQIQEFGQTPSQLFLAAHPRRNDLSAPIVTAQSSTSSASASNAAGDVPTKDRTSQQAQNNTSNSNQSTVSAQQRLSSSSPVPSPSAADNNAGSTSFGNSLSNNSFTAGINALLRPRSMHSSAQNNRLVDQSNSPLPSSASPSSSSVSALAPPRPGTPTMHTLLSPTHSAASSSSVAAHHAVNGRMVTPPLPLHTVVRTTSSHRPTEGANEDDEDEEELRQLLQQKDLQDEDEEEEAAAPIMHLGDDFRAALESELGVSMLHGEEDEGAKDGQTLRKLGSSSQLNATGSSPMTPMQQPPQSLVMDAAQLRLFPSELFYWHTKAVTDVSLQIVRCVVDDSDLEDRHQGKEGPTAVYLPAAGRKKLSAVLATVSKDALMKVVRVEEDLDLSQLFHLPASVATMTPASAWGSASRTQCTIARSFSASGSSLAACVLSHEAGRVTLGSFDNHVYGYGIASASALGKKFAHYDAVTSIALDETEHMLATGSLDGTVKLWSHSLPSTGAGHGRAGSLGPAGVSGFGVAGLGGLGSAAGFLSGGALAEYEDHELPVVKVAITSADAGGAGGACYVAGGAEDGSVVVWDTATHNALFTFACSPGRRSVTALHWIHPQTPASSSTGTAAGNGSNGSVARTSMLLVATQDGKLLCLNLQGQLVAALQLDCVILCLGSLQEEGRVLLGGANDGSLRVFTLSVAAASMGIMSSGGGRFKEVQRIMKAHGGPVSALCLASVPVSAVVSADTDASSLRHPHHHHQQQHRQQSMAGSKMPAELLVTGSEDCSVKIWRLAYER